MDGSKQSSWRQRRPGSATVRVTFPDRWVHHPVRHVMDHSIQILRCCRIPTQHHRSSLLSQLSSYEKSAEGHRGRRVTDPARGSAAVPQHPRAADSAPQFSIGHTESYRCLIHYLDIYHCHIVSILRSARDTPVRPHVRFTSDYPH